MPHFSIVPSGTANAVSEFDASDSGDILNHMHRAGCRHADIYRDGDYLLSARLGQSEVWSLYTRRDAEAPRGAVPVPLRRPGER